MTVIATVPDRFLHTDLHPPDAGMAWRVGHRLANHPQDVVGQPAGSALGMADSRSISAP